MDEHTALAVLPLMRGLATVSAAAFSAEGKLIAAEGFLGELLPAGADPCAFESPTWSELGSLAAAAAAADEPVHAGEIRLSPGSQALSARIWRAGGAWLLVAELPPDDVEPLSRTTVRLSNDLALARRELEELRGRHSASEEQLRVLAFADRITGLGNQRAFNQAVAAEALRTERYGQPLSLLVAAIDEFESFSEERGSEAAEEVLRCFARVVCNETRKTDNACRVAPNRFMMLLPHTECERAAAVSERIRTAFSAASPGIAGRIVTASFGYAAWRAGDDAAALADRAGDALAAARALGDRVMVA
ncbi:MAG: GGDEF domain-containing protein [Usitatibacter sp.]